MRISSFSYVLSIGSAAALLCACGGGQPPMSAGAIPQVSALAARPGGTHNYKVVYSFGGPPDGETPRANLIDVGGTLYGTTYGGGSTSFCCGTVFSITPSGTERVLHTFGVGSDGYFPDAGLTDVGGTFYGTSSEGGSKYCPYGASSSYYPCGTVFSITPNGTEKVLYSFGPGRDGNWPVASLIEVKGTLYGTTEHGGTQNKCGQRCGTVFSVTPGGTEKVLHSFGKGTDGFYPEASLIEVKSKLYGATQNGGAYNYYGTVFSITLSGREKVLHSFGNGTDGSFPIAGLIDIDGTLYGTTSRGGAYGGGTVFSITPSGTEKVLHSFGYGTDGQGPSASLIKVQGTLYGTTGGGGAYGHGTVFRITLSGREKVLHSFGHGTDGVQPLAALTDVDGTLYGTTVGGGTNGCCYGTVFALTP